SSRLAQMAIVDFIIVRLLQQGFNETGKLLETTYSAIQDHRI
ncbi:MAG: RpiR family transcriptional regulator, partial [Actinomycetales bacterium]